MPKPRTREQALFYLAGLWDGEGCIYLKYHEGNSYGRRMDVVNTDSSIMDMAAYCLDLLEIPYARPTGEELLSLYNNEDLTMEEIGDRYGVSAQAVRQWLQKLDVPRRAPGRRKGFVSG